MRFVSWNCCEGFARDLVHLRELGCDVAVLAEVPRVVPASRSLFDAAIDWQWAGYFEGKGLAVAGFGSTVTPLDARADAGTHCLAAETEFGFGVLGIWSCPPKGSTYGAQVRSAIAAHADWLADGPAIVAGDFNLQPDGLEDKRTGVLRAVFADMADLGYVSAYHHVTGDEYGAETTPTYFHQRKQAAPFHIDFCFVHRDLLPRITALQVGSFDHYVAPQGTLTGLSDHVPLIVDLDCHTAGRHRQ